MITSARSICCSACCTVATRRLTCSPQPAYRSTPRGPRSTRREEPGQSRGTSRSPRTPSTCSRCRCARRWRSTTTSSPARTSPLPCSTSRAVRRRASSARSTPTWTSCVTASLRSSSTRAPNPTADLVVDEGAESDSGPRARLLGSLPREPAVSVGLGPVELRSQRDLLADALRRYGRHEAGCPGESGPCGCGLAAVLALTETRPEPG